MDTAVVLEVESLSIHAYCLLLFSISFLSISI